MAERRRAAPVSDNEVSPESLRTYKSKRHANTKDKSFFDTHLKRKFLLGVLIVSLLLFFCFVLWNTFFSDLDQDSDSEKRSSSSHSQPLNYRTGSGNLKGFRDIKDQINIVLTFTNIEKNPRLREKLKICVSSIFKHTSSKVIIFLIGDRFSQIVAGEIIDGAALAVNTRIRYQVSKTVSLPFLRGDSYKQKKKSFMLRYIYTLGLHVAAFNFFTILLKMHVF